MAPHRFFFLPALDDIVCVAGNGDDADLDVLADLAKRCRISWRMPRAMAVMLRFRYLCEQQKQINISLHHNPLYERGGGAREKGGIIR